MAMTYGLSMTDEDIMSGLKSLMEASALNADRLEAMIRTASQGLEAMIQDTNHKVDVTAQRLEGMIQGLDQKIDSTAQSLPEIFAQSLERTNCRVDVLTYDMNRRFDRVDQRFDAMDQRMATLEKRRR
jgi:hypothetical protein